MHKFDMFFDAAQVGSDATASVAFVDEMRPVRGADVDSRVGERNVAIDGEPSHVVGM